MAELELCPFCGGEAHLCELRQNYPQTMYMVECIICFAKTNLLPDRDAVVNAWNRRADNE